ncbi:hypothetical protein BU23DRAFT_564423 [Bimuria novae-zelandiae CBS 107.79]|uniref:Uncharacterized protein n=1 Tax=Bimuria novae-zelandiae CBS 107.79 TaxID=1447943 RepID=A0A6A5VR56_9PLEO|nr:hypothetical protein BU23DRAFT_564423 [Bimuria novae-zelandiae CBS 107.79]
MAHSQDGGSELPELSGASAGIGYNSFYHFAWHKLQFTEQQKEWQSMQSNKEPMFAALRPLSPPPTPPSTPPPSPSPENPSKPIQPVFNPRKTQSAKEVGDSNSESKRHLGKVEQDELFFNVSEDYSQGSILDTPQQVRRPQTQTRLPASLVPGRKIQEASQPVDSESKIADPDMPATPFYFSNFRNTLPDKLRPKKPSLQRDSDSAPQIPPVVSQGSSSLLDDEDLKKFMTTDKPKIDSLTGKSAFNTAKTKGTRS